jgi:hypothetical protein
MFQDIVFFYRQPIAGRFCVVYFASIQPSLTLVPLVSYSLVSTSLPAGFFRFHA